MERDFELRQNKFNKVAVTCFFLRTRNNTIKLIKLKVNAYAQKKRRKVFVPCIHFFVAKKAKRVIGP